MPVGKEKERKKSSERATTFFSLIKKNVCEGKTKKKKEIGMERNGNDCSDSWSKKFLLQTHDTYAQTFVAA